MLHSASKDPATASHAFEIELQDDAEPEQPHTSSLPHASLLFPVADILRTQS